MENQEGRINYRWPNICIYIKFADKILYKNILEMVICFPIFSAHLTQSHSRCMENSDAFLIKLVYSIIPIHRCHKIFFRLSQTFNCYIVWNLFTLEFPERLFQPIRERNQSKLISKFHLKSVFLFTIFLSFHFSKIKSGQVIVKNW